MNIDQFSNFYLNSTRVGTQKDVDMLINAYISIHGDFASANGKWAKNNLNETTKLLKTRMLSNGCQAKDATRVINAFKKWVNDMF